MQLIRLKVQGVDQIGGADRIVVRCTYDRSQGKLAGDTFAIRGNDATEYCNFPKAEHLSVDQLVGLVANELEIRHWQSAHGDNWNLESFLRDKIRA